MSIAPNTWPWRQQPTKRPVLSNLDTFEESTRPAFERFITTHFFVIGLWKYFWNTSVISKLSYRKDKVQITYPWNFWINQISISFCMTSNEQQYKEAKISIFGNCQESSQHFQNNYIKHFLVHLTIFFVLLIVALAKFFLALPVHLSVLTDIYPLIQKEWLKNLNEKQELNIFHVSIQGPLNS